MGILTALTPHSPNIWLLYLCFVLLGMSGGVWNNANNVWLIEMWQQNSAPVLQLSQFMFGIGAILGPLIDKPYLTGEQDLDRMNQTFILDLNSTISNSNKTLFIIDESERKFKLKTPFLISGIIQLIGILLMICFLIYLYKNIFFKAQF
jgi:MFS family permease